MKTYRVYATLTPATMKRIEDHIKGGHVKSISQCIQKALWKLFEQPLADGTRRQ